MSWSFAERVVHWAKDYLNTHIGFPHFSQDYLRCHIERPETEPSELQEYRPKHEARLLKILSISSLIFACCSLMFPLSVMREFNLLVPSANFKPIRAQSTGSRAALKSFSCLATNCTQLQVQKISSSSSKVREEKLARDFLELPLFSICHPWLSFLTANVQFLGSSGMLVGVLLTFSVLLSGLLLPLFQVQFSKSDNLLVMLLVAPRVTRRVVLDRALELYDELEKSRTNFKHYLKYGISRLSSASEYDEINRTQQQVNTSLYDTHLSKIERLHSDNHTLAHRAHMPWWRTPNEEGPQPKPEVKKSDYRLEFANDCVTIVRSDWWRFEATRAIFLLLVFSLACIPIYVLLICHKMTQSMQELQLKTWIVGEFVHLNNCTIWIEDEHDGVRTGDKQLPGHRMFDLTQYQIEYHTLIAMLPALFQCIWPFISVDIFIIIYLITNAELICWLYEIKFQLQLLVEYLRQLLAVATPPVDQAPRPLGDDTQHFRLEELRKMFAANTHLRWLILVRHRKLSFNRRFESNACAIEALVGRSIRRQSLGLGAAIELIEKVHVSFRLFVEHVHQYGPTISLMICFINVYTYGFVVVSIWYLRQVDNRHPLPYLVMTSGWISVNFLIGYASNFHAKAKELHPLIHSLLAATCKVQNFRLRHMRNLWLKQVGALDRENGLALKAFNLSITYIRIIQLIIGSGTVVVFALRG